MFSPNNGKYDRGDFAFLSIRDFGKGSKYGKINANIEASAEEEFDEKVVRHDCIRAFAEQTKAPVIQKKSEDSGELSPTVLRLLTRLMFEYQKTLLKPIARYRMLANANIMAELVGDEVSSSYILFARTYLRALVQFVRKEDFGAVKLVPSPEYSNAKSTLVRLSVIDLLREYGRKEVCAE